ncbi:hypothetical protein GCM10022241_17430 [Micrococcus endophyticus]
MVPIPNSGNGTIGSSEVTGIGTASVIHHTAIQRAARPRRGPRRRGRRTWMTSGEETGSGVLRLTLGRPFMDQEDRVRKD